MSDFPLGYRNLPVNLVLGMISKAVDNIRKTQDRNWIQKVERTCARKNVEEENRLLVRLGLSKPRVWTELEIEDYLNTDGEFLGMSSWAVHSSRYNALLDKFSKVSLSCRVGGALSEILLSLEMIALLQKWQDTPIITESL